MSITIIAAVGRGGAIGRAGGLPWHYPEDMRHFRDVTMGKVVVMGRRTWESLPAKARPLPGRANVVLSSGPGRLPAWVVRGWDAVWSLSECRDVMVIGGASIYELALRHGVDRLLITEVDVEVPDADTWCPWLPTTWFCGTQRAGNAKVVGGPAVYTVHVEDRDEKHTYQLSAMRKGETPELTFCEWVRR